MDIKGLDYNTQRKKLIMPEYGREIQEMVNHAIGIEDREMRQQCAETIVEIMERMVPINRGAEDYKRKLWDHLAIISDFKLDIDYPYDIEEARQMSAKPEPLPYPMTHIPVRHYGKIVFELFETLKQMPDSEERDELVRQTANQMKRDLLQWSHGSCDDEKIADDLEHFTDGAIHLDLSTFKFEKMNERDLVDNQFPNKKRKG